MFIKINRTARGFEVADQDMRVAMRKLYVQLRTTRDATESRRQLGKFVQFGLYNSEKVQHDLTARPAAALAA